ncbi:MAG: transporter [Alphaproteobacteria bacterium]|nr:transporter [Alphaproteobacteria bacterium]MCB9974216.1 transporter [Rhodospirillales bacterium]
MAALTPVISLLGTIGSAVTAGTAVLGGVQTIAGIGNSRQEKQDALALDQLKRQQNLQQKQLEERAALERQQIALNTQQAEEQRKQALRRAVSRQRASFGSQGVGSASGSSQAVLLGLFDESDEERLRREELDALRSTALDQNISQSRALNVLQRTQLAERQRLARQLF